MILVAAITWFGLAVAGAAFVFRITRGLGEATRILALHGLFGVTAMAIAALGVVLRDDRLLLLALALVISGFVTVHALAAHTLTMRAEEAKRDA